MRRSITNGPPSPEEFQRRLSEFMRQHFPGGPGVGFSRADADKGAEENEPGKDEDRFKFDYKPRDVKAYLAGFVIKQEDAKKVLSVALCDHYHHVRLAMEGHD